MTPHSKVDVVMLTRNGGQVIRGHCNWHYHHETNAEHTYNMVNLIMLLHPNPSVNLLKAAQWHDVPEALTGDIPSPAKRRWPQIKEATLRAEKEIAKEYGLAVKLTDDELHWLKAADKLDYFLYAKNEAAMGNYAARTKAEKALGDLMSSNNTPDEMRSFITKMEDSVCSPALK